MYSIREIKKIIDSCKNYTELTKACDGFQAIIKDGGVSDSILNFLRIQSISRFKELKT